MDDEVQNEIELNRLQQNVVRRMTQSKATIPHFHLRSQVDMTEAVASKSNREKEPGAPTPTVNDLVIKASSVALHEMPRVNASYTDGKVSLNPKVNVGFAVATADALVIPTVFDADRKTLSEIATDTSALIQRARDDSITPPELSGGTFTVSNLGMYAVTSFEAVINPPQAAVLAVGAITRRAVPTEDGEFEAREMMELTLGCDHRVLYGADAARFVTRIRELLEDPEEITSRA